MSGQHSQPTERERERGKKEEERIVRENEEEEENRRRRKKHVSPAQLARRHLTGVLSPLAKAVFSLAIDRAPGSLSDRSFLSGDR